MPYTYIGIIAGVIAASLYTDHIKKQKKKEEKKIKVPELKLSKPTKKEK